MGAEADRSIKQGVSASRQPTTLAGNVVWGLLGQGIPLLVALVAFPFLLKGLGTDRFGILSLVWMAIGYCSLFDLGLGRALTKLLAERLDAGKKENAGLAWTAWSLMLLLGCLMTVLILLVSPWLVHEVFRIPVSMQPESLDAFYLLAVSVPFVIVSSGLRGFLEAYQRFDRVNFVRIALGVFTFAGPLFVLPFSHRLAPMVTVLLLGRIAASIAYFRLCMRTVPALGKGPEFRREMMTPLLHFGGWVTVSNVFGPLMVYLDRFLIGALVSMSAVAYYVAPYEIVTKLWLIPAALASALFPIFSTSTAAGWKRASRLYALGLKVIFFALFPVILIFITLAPEGLSLWLGPDFSMDSTWVLRWLSVGVLVNCFAQIPFALVQAVNRPDMTAKFHLIELPFYFLFLWWMLKSYGIEGAAIAWTARAGVDMLLLFGFSRRFVGFRVLHTRRTPIFAIFMLLCLAGAMMPSLAARVGMLLLSMLFFVPMVWLFFFTVEDRRLLVYQLKQFFPYARE